MTTSQSSNAANQVVGWTYDAAGNLTSDGTTAYTYDALGRTLTQGSTSYASNGDGVLVAAGATRYAQDLASPLSQILNDPSTGLGAGGSANYVYGLNRLASSAGTWYLGDALGSVHQTLDASGAVLSTASYDPWGTPQGSSIAPFGFTGELQSGSSVYLRARWYNPDTGIFTSRDPFEGVAEQPYSLSYYPYAFSNPVLLTDPSGLYSSSPVEMMIQVYYEQSSFRLLTGIVVPEFSIYLGSKRGLLLNPAGHLTGELTGNEGYIDILDITGDKNIGYAYEIKPLGSPNSNKVSPIVARAEIDRYVELYNTLPIGSQKSPYHSSLEPRVMKLGHLFPSSWQIIGSNPERPREAILARRPQNGVIVWRSQSKSRIMQPLPSFVFEFDKETRTVRKQPPTQPSWPTGIVNQPVCATYCLGGEIQASGDCYMPYGNSTPWFVYPTPPELITSPGTIPVRIPVPVP